MDYSSNILKWYPFKEKSEILEIYNKKSIFNDIDGDFNIKKISIHGIKLDGKFDYITLIGSFEEVSTIVNEENPYTKFLIMLKEHLNPNGKILLAVDNRVGTKYFVGAKNKNYKSVFKGIESKVDYRKSNCLLKCELIKFITEANFKFYKFYYPLPDYKNANVIYTDEYLPHSDSSKIVYPVNYEEGSKILYNEINLVKQLSDMGIISDFVNSYLVEISNDEINNDIKFINFNNYRKNKYRTILKINKNNVEKIAANKLAGTHIDKMGQYIYNLKELGFNIIDTYENGKIQSEFIDKKELDKQIVNDIKNGFLEKAYNKIDKWYNYIETKLTNSEIVGKDVFEEYKIKVPNNIKEKLHIVKDGYIDLSFENTFLDNCDYLFFDQEWKFENIPLEFILYRSINNLYAYNSTEIETIISKKHFYKKYNILDFSNYFEQLEKYFQEEIIDNDIVRDYQKNIESYNIDIEKLLNSKTFLEKEVNKLNSEYGELVKQYEELKQVKRKYEELENRYNTLQFDKSIIEDKYNSLLMEYNTSRGWKFIKGVRKFLGKG